LSDLIKQCNKLSETYQALNGKCDCEDAAKKGWAMLEKWNSEREDMKRLLHLGRDSVGRCVDRKLATGTTLVPATINIDEEENALVEQLFSSSALDDEEGMPLGKSMNYAQRGFAKMCKALPDSGTKKA
jgi:hypothetical protein